MSISIAEQIKNKQPKVYQPWSSPLLHISLLETQLEDLLKMTDSIAEDTNRKSGSVMLAGEIQNEWQMKDYEDLAKVLCVSELLQTYFKVFSSQFPVDEGSYVDQSLTIFAQNLKRAVVTAAWFNDQKDNEYNPVHDHEAILSGVLYLKIPEYLPSRKNKKLDGSIHFLANEMKTESMMTNSNMILFPKVGDLFLFSSSLKHLVYPFRTVDGKGIRRSMSFNIGCPV